jgi:hypothetical protein
MLFPLCEKVKHSYVLLEMSYFYYLEKLWAFDLQKQILQGTTTELFKTHKTGNVQDKSE